MATESNNKKEILTDTDLQELLGVSRTTLWRLRKEQKLPYARVGRKYRYIKEDVIKWLRQSSHGKSQVSSR